MERIRTPLTSSHGLLRLGPLLSILSLAGCGTLPAIKFAQPPVALIASDVVVKGAATVRTLDRGGLVAKPPDKGQNLAEAGTSIARSIAFSKAGGISRSLGIVQGDRPKGKCEIIIKDLRTYEDSKGRKLGGIDAEMIVRDEAGKAIQKFTCLIPPKSERGKIGEAMDAEENAKYWGIAGAAAGGMIGNVVKMNLNGKAVDMPAALGRGMFQLNEAFGGASAAAARAGQSCVYGEILENPKLIQADNGTRDNKKLDFLDSLEPIGESDETKVTPYQREADLVRRAVENLMAQSEKSKTLFSDPIKLRAKKAQGLELGLAHLKNNSLQDAIDAFEAAPPSPARDFNLAAVYLSRSSADWAAGLKGGGASRGTFFTDLVRAERLLKGSLQKFPGEAGKVAEVTQLRKKMQPFAPAGFDPSVLDSDPASPGQPAPASQPQTEAVDAPLPAFTGKKHAFLIGIGDFPQIPDSQLLGPPKDVELMRETLVRHAGFKSEDIVTLVNESASFGNVRRELIAFAQRVREGDLALILIGTHGLAPNASDTGIGGQAFIICSDSKLADLPASAYPMIEFRYQLDLFLRPNARVVVFQDTCHSGAISSGKGLASMDFSQWPRGMAYFAAASESQPSYEMRSRTNGVFTYALAEKLRETKGKISMGELGAHVQTAIPALAMKENQARQDPQVFFGPGAESMRLN